MRDRVEAPEHWLKDKGDNGCPTALPSDMRGLSLLLLQGGSWYRHKEYFYDLY